MWLKAKHVSEVDVVCAAVIGPIKRPTEIVAVPIGGELRIVGHSSPLKARTAGRSPAGCSPLRDPTHGRPW
ncbi:hypothetical protein QF047_002165 [Arthrobacter sp. W4I7]|nr:hypothetical protein [Arthrobacter sp. W4I7]